MDENMDDDSNTMGSINEAIDIYPWLANLDVCRGTVIAYSFGEVTFVSIGTGSELELYFEDGTFYCSSSESFDCLAFYELDQTVGMWECTSDIGSIAAATNVDLKSIPNELNVFPNPFSDYIELESKEKITDINIFSSDGRELMFINTQNKNRLNVSTLESGVYFIRLKTAHETITRQIIKL